MSVVPPKAKTIGSDVGAPFAKRLSFPSVSKEILPQRLYNFLRHINLHPSRMQPVMPRLTTFFRKIRNPQGGDAMKRE